MMGAGGSTRGGPVASRPHAPAVGGSRWRNLNPAFYRDAPAGAIFKRSQFTQAALDIIALIAIAAFVVVSGLAITAAFFILFFVRVS